MRKLWSAATVKVYGSGVSEIEFFAELSQLIGDYEHTSASTSQPKQGCPVSRAPTRERILDVAELGALPKGRAVVIASGSRPTLVRTLPWMAGPHATAVKASIRRHDPAGDHTIDAAEREADRVELLTDAGPP